MNNQQGNRNLKGLTPRPQFPIWYIVVAIGLMLVVQNMLFAQPFEHLPYSEFRTFLRQGQVEEIQISTQTIRGKLRPQPSSTSAPPPPRRFVTVRVDDPELIRTLETNGVQYSGRYESDFLKNLLSWLIPLGLLFILWGFLSRRFGPGQGVLNFGKSRARRYAERETGVTFTEVADHRLSPPPAEICRTRRPHSERCAAGRSARHGQDSPGAGRGRRSVCTVL
jgi:cell division protease FtsH